MIKNMATITFTGSGEILEVDLGFIPDFVRLIAEGNDAAIDFTDWYRIREDEWAEAKRGGILINEGVTSNISQATAGGIRSFTGAKKTPTISEWSTAVSTAATARAGAVPGTYVRPTITGNYDKSSVFECVTAGTGTAVEPNWDSAPAIGDRVKDGAGGDTEWERVNVSQTVKQCAGIKIAAAMVSDSVDYTLIAMRGDIVKAFGDAANYPVGVTASSRILSLP